ncbi:hypothetical protein AMTRI_Chr10g228470 [Amborella trichopoda]
MHDLNKSSNDLRTSKNERIELGKKFQTAISFHNWEFTESLLPLADMPRLNDAMCIALDSIWFLRTESELRGIIGLIRMLISNGANDFTRVALRTSFFASCVSLKEPNKFHFYSWLKTWREKLGKNGAREKGFGRKKGEFWKEYIKVKIPRVLE